MIEYNLLCPKPTQVKRERLNLRQNIKIVTVQVYSLDNFSRFTKS